MQQFYSNGKLLLSGEYVVLDGAKSLAIPTVFGQGMTVTAIKDPEIHWTSLTVNNTAWFQGSAHIPNSLRETIVFNAATAKDEKTAQFLSTLFTEIRALNPKLITGNNGFKITTQLTFPKDWGLGSSSTLIHNLALWAQIDPYTLLWNSFSGSGYDIACAGHQLPIMYQLQQKKPIVKEIDFNPSFRDSLFFIYLNRKQNSREGIAHYKAHTFDVQKVTAEISELTDAMGSCNALSEFKICMEKHESIIGNVIQQPTIKDRLFSDYRGAIKSLGAWGGDFILATGDAQDRSYFKSKGYAVVIPFNEMILHPST